MAGGMEGGRKPPDLGEILRKAVTEKTGLEGLFAPNEREITPADIEEAFRYAPLEKNGQPFEAEGVAVRNVAEKQVLTLPQPDLIGALHTADSRIESMDVGLLALDDAGRLPVVDSNMDVAYSRYISHALVSRVFRDFPNQKTLLARGTAASINGPISEGKVLVRDIRHVLSLGQERGNDSTLLASIGFDDDNVPYVHHRINQFLISAQLNLREKFPPAVGKAIFPVLLVYDQTKMKAAGGHAYILPTNATERSSCILKAYVLPRPNFYLSP